MIGFYAAQFPTIVANTTGPAKELLINRNLDGKPQLTLAKIRDPDCIVRGNMTLNTVDSYNGTGQCVKFY